jgi:hypothetical protein
MNDGPNMYAYVGNAPANRVDPRGLFGLPDITGGIGGQGSVHFLFGGFAVNCGFSLDTNAVGCFQCGGCMRLGPGAMLSAQITVPTRRIAAQAERSADR